MEKNPYMSKPFMSNRSFAKGFAVIVAIAALVDFIAIISGIIGVGLLSKMMEEIAVTEQEAFASFNRQAIIGII